MSAQPSIDIGQIKRLARLIRKQCLSGDNDAAEIIVSHVGVFSETPKDDLTAGKVRLQHKHALEAAAKLSGYASWESAKAKLGDTAADDERFYPDGASRFLNHWFAVYDDAREFLETNGGYLLPYKEDYFVCGKDFITWLGFSPHDDDWKRIDNDWVRPTDLSARKRLEKRFDKARSAAA